MVKTMLLTLLLGFVVSVNAQTKGGTKPTDDFDGDGVVNSVDLDGDNDGILDEIEKQKTDFAFSGFKPLFPSTLPAADDSGLRLAVGNRVIVRDALTYMGVKYHAIVEIKSAVLNSGAKVVITSKDELAIQDGNTKNNPYFTFTLNFVSSVGFVDANYQNNNPILNSASIPNVNVTFADVDGAESSKGQGEVVGYKSVSTITRLPLVGANLNSSSVGFEYPTLGGPGAGVYNYYRPKLTNGTSGVGPGNESNTEKKNWLTIYYDTFTVGDYVFGLTGPDDRARPEAGPSFRLENIDIADVDNDTFDNVYDLDSDEDGCSDSNEAYGSVAKANSGYQFGNPVITSTGANPIPGGQGGIANTDDGDDWSLPDGKIFSIDAAYATTTAQYKPAVTKTIVNKPADVQFLDNTQTSATFTTSAKDPITNVETASGSQTYKWQQKLSGSSATWTDIVVDASGKVVINGVTYSIDPFDTSTLNITNITSALHNSDYRAVMSDAVYLVCGPITSLPGNLKLATPPNPSPIAVDDNYTVAEDGTVTLTPLALDTDADPLTITKIGGTALTPGTAQSIVVTNGTVNVTAAGVISFTPTANFNSVTPPVSIAYEITDGTSTATANELITVTPVNDAPVAVNDIYTVEEDKTVVLTPLDLDTDIDGDVLKVVSINGTALTGAAQVIAVTNGTVNVTAAGVISFTPAANFNSATPVSIAYVINDGSGATNATATANELITVTPVLDMPTPNDSGTVITKGDPPANLPIIDKITSVDGPIDLTKIDIVIDLDPITPGIQDTFTNGEGTYTVDPDGKSVTFTPVDTFDGPTSPIDFVIVVTDKTDPSATPIVSPPAKISVTVNADADGDGVIDTREDTDGTDKNNACSSNPASVTLPRTGDFSKCDITIYTGMSPNGDSSYDVFTITNIENYPNNTLQIFDRWGVQVYEASGYGTGDKLFKGVSEGRSTVSASSELPVGTYFYALKYVDALGATQERSGYLYINR